jgi:protein phosphatase
MLVTQAGPLVVDRLLSLAQRMIGMLAYLHHQGLSLVRLMPANILISADGESFSLFDLDIDEVFQGPVPIERRGADVAALAALLWRYTPVDAPDLQRLFRVAEKGGFKDAMEFGAELVGLLNTAREPTTIDASVMTDVGLHRPLNEDNWSWQRFSDSLTLYVVADGMGGHEAGEIASEIASTTICEEMSDRLLEFVDPSDEALENILDESFQRANNAIKEYSQEIGNDMGTTMVAALVIENRLALVANVGDSRAYLLRAGQLHQISRDHSLVGRLVEQGRLTAEEARVHPNSNILLRTVGTERNVDIDIFRVELEPRDLIFLNSDGLWGEVEDVDIQGILNDSDSLTDVNVSLVRAAHLGGGKDNITVMVVRIP